MSAPQHRSPDAASGTTVDATTDDAGRHPLRLRRFIVLGVLVALLLAGVVSAFASANPDGLDSVTRAGCTFNAQDQVVSGHCLAQQARKHGLEGSPFAGYATRGLDGPASTGLSGVVGVVVTLGIAFGLAVMLRRRDTPRQNS